MLVSILNVFDVLFLLSELKKQRFPESIGVFKASCRPSPHQVPVRDVGQSPKTLPHPAGRIVPTRHLIVRFTSPREPQTIYIAYRSAHSGSVRPGISHFQRDLLPIPILSHFNWPSFAGRCPAVGRSGSYPDAFGEFGLSASPHGNRNKNTWREHAPALSHCRSPLMS